MYTCRYMYRYNESKTQNACFPFLSTRPIGNLLQLNGSKAFLRVLDCVKTMVWSVPVTRRLHRQTKCERLYSELFFLLVFFLFQHYTEVCQIPMHRTVILVFLFAPADRFASLWYALDLSTDKYRCIYI